MKFALIAAADRRMGIGKNNTLPWNLPSDLAYFNAKTRGNGKNAVIMGRLTWESLPKKWRPLPGRKNIVVTRNVAYKLPAGVLIAGSLDSAIKLAEVGSPDETFVIGGAQIFSEAIAHSKCETIYLTAIEGDFACDTFFPAINPEKFRKMPDTKKQTENGISFTFSIYEAIR